MPHYFIDLCGVNSSCVSSTHRILTPSVKITHTVNLYSIIDMQSLSSAIKGKAIPLQAWTGPEGSRRLRLPDFKTFGT